jgi:hypothetical protein
MSPDLELALLTVHKNTPHHHFPNKDTLVAPVEDKLFKLVVVDGGGGELLLRFGLGVAELLGGFWCILVRKG